MNDRVVVKFGGSLINSALELMSVLKGVSSKKKVLVVPGGGPFTEAVRELEREASDSTSHWMAIKGMEAYGLYLANGGVPTVETPSFHNQISIFLPFRYLKEHDELPHSWAVTSDTIGAWTAHRHHAAYLKLTDVDGVFARGRFISEIHPGELLNLKKIPVDDALPSFLSDQGLDCILINGKRRDRIEAFFSDQPFRGTLISASHR